MLASLRNPCLEHEALSPARLLTKVTLHLTLRLVAWWEHRITAIFYRMTRTRVLAAVVCRDAKYLMCQRPTHKRHGGLWEFPGGKLEGDETLLEAAGRELTEELGVETLSVGSPLFSTSDPGSEFLIEFVPTVIDGDPQCLEHSALRWLSLEELPSLDLAPSDRRFVEFLLATDIHEQLPSAL
jgi:8-oxo-dGTP diphosphatase